ncbi:hypothetical protein [Variovorax sp. LjRoot178]|uniref:hypothetical protein n=1 Tax=Variovorax sp. LjRoot178 TaxID=3342277 RepID=UPI003ECD9F45
MVRTILDSCGVGKRAVFHRTSEIEMKTAPTATLVARLKREAKLVARAKQQSHANALDEAARAHGYENWHELHEQHLQHARAAPVPSLDLPIDPRLPRGFDFTPNDERSAQELAEWWDRPFALSRPDGGFEVRCLDGGAWDRSTWYGSAKDIDDAREIAARMLARWKKHREAPVVMLDVDRVVVARMEQRPGDGITELGVFGSTNEAREFIETLREGAPPA